MKVIDSEIFEAQEIKMESVKNVSKKALITEKDGAPNFALRLFEVGIDGYTPFHNHPWEHEVYILEGSGELLTSNGTKTLSPGNAVFVPGNEMHQFKNIGYSSFKFLCIVPHEGDK